MLNNLAGKKVLIRVDFNVPLNGQNEITDDTRIQKALPTINAVLEQGASVILMSHLGRPQKKLNEDGSINKAKFTLKHIVPHLSKVLDRDVKFASDTIGPIAYDYSVALKPGDVLLLENTRFFKGESKGDDDLAAKLAKLGDAYINDAFGTAHRKHASTATIAKYFEPEDRDYGLLMAAELESADKVMNSPRRPFTAILGGAKVSDKIQLIEKLLDFTDHILIGGGMSYTFTKAIGGKIGTSLVEDEHLDLALELIEKAKERNVELHFPLDNLCTTDFSNDTEIKVMESKSIEDGWMGLDIGPKTIEAFKKVILGSQTILWNGPVGVFEFENYAKGTFAIGDAVAEATKKGAYSLIGGGDSVSAINKAGLADEVSFCSTGGGAMLKYLEGSTLPGLKALK